MIQVQSKLKINDNSGIKLGQCIKIYKSKVGKIGDKILISEKKLRLNKKKKTKIRKGDLFKALIIHTTYQKKSTIGNMIKFDKNCIIILNNQNSFIDFIFKKGYNFDINKINEDSQIETNIQRTYSNTFETSNSRSIRRRIT